MTDRRTANDTTDRPALPSAAAGGGRVAAKQASCIPLPVVAYSSRLPKRVELSELASREALLAQKRSSDVALAETQIAAERDLKRARLEAQALVSEKAELASRIKILERRLAEAESETAAIRRQLEQSKIESQAKIDAIVESHRQEDNLAEKCETINAELVDLRTRLEAKAAENKSLQTAIETVEAKLEASERYARHVLKKMYTRNEKCEDLMQLRTEDKAALDELNSAIMQFLSRAFQVQDLESENASLKDNYERISRGPGNASSLVSRPDGSGLCLRSSSILQSTRLEQRVAKLESENADLRRSASQLAVAHTEVEGLKAHLERANQWRERALLAEDKVAKLADERDSTAASLVDKHVLLQSQRENEILLADQGQLRSELRATSTELRTVKESCDNLTEERNRLKAAMECLEVRSRRLNRRVVILQQERDMYKRFVDSYEDADATLSSPAGELVHQFSDMVGKLAESLQTFHRQAESDDCELRRLHSDVVSCLSKPSVHAVGCEKLSSAYFECFRSKKEFLLLCRQTNAELQERIESLENARLEAEREIECLRTNGAYNPDETQVLHFKANPATEAKRSREEELVSLRKENAQLQQRVNCIQSLTRPCTFQILQERVCRLYESRSKQTAQGDVETTESGNITLAVHERLKDHPDPISEIQMSESIPSNLIVELKSQLRTEKWRGDRLMETFATASSEFREACSLLFGYNLQIRQPGIYKIQLSSTACNRGEYLKFKVIRVLNAICTTCAFYHFPFDALAYR
ncbi:unnamed protein product [Mesocestoides corti]|uniref:Spindle assembly checkpoint component MAD1 n=1 Tax=Mesocestoides corti TaxID=53468 RepID=A0A0R3U7C9_MESCO|nr:unnamed protein product [Mesocestoides corti]